MARQIKDPGLGSKYQQGERRLLNKDGTFNVKKIGIPGNIRDTYQHLVKMKWGRFFLITLVIIFLINLVFAGLYAMVGVEGLTGDLEGGFWQNLSQCFYFSFQTFTTVGYGHIAPVGKLVNFISIIESTTGLMVFAVITGLLYGRFSKPSMRLLFSKNALIAPYKEGWALMFRIVNLRKSILLEMKASVALTIHTEEQNENKRNYFRLNLEIDQIEFFPATWTLVHPITEDSPFYKMDLTQLNHQDLEIIIQLKGFDDTFSQHVHSRSSYIGKEIVVGGKFEPTIEIDDEGEIIIPLDRFHDFRSVPYP